jgi:photosystem II stability/assembly factor-like uncharacterized protein
MVAYLSAACVGLVSVTVQAGEVAAVSKLARTTHFHGIAVDRADPSRIYLATHHGLFVASRDGVATRVSQSRDDVMSFVPHPTNPSVFYGSGHAGREGDLGVIVSEDAGRTWTKIGEGVEGSGQFHHIAISQTNPNILYGVFTGLQVSKDGGRSWAHTGPVPEGLTDLAVAGKSAAMVYAATESGLMMSHNQGQSWEPAHAARQPATVVQAAPNGDVYAFIVGVGLLRSNETERRWRFVQNPFGERYPVHLAVDLSNAENLYVILNTSEILASEDSGLNWATLGQ